MPIVPTRFLIRMMYPCPYIAKMPLDDDDSLIELPEAAKLDSLADLDQVPVFADVRLGWNQTGVGLAVEVRGKDNPAIGDVERPRQSDGITLWLDTRGDRSSHRATRTCHQFHFLAAGGGVNKDEPVCVQSKIHRALMDAPLASANDIPFRCERIKGGYRLEAFLSGNVLAGFDPEQYPQWGIFYAVRDFEKGEQTLSVDSDFPFAEDPSLWATLELVKNSEQQAPPATRKGKKK